MSKEQTQHQADVDVYVEDQYCRPGCGPRSNQMDYPELGPDTTQLLGLLRGLESNDAAMESVQSKYVLRSE